MPTWWLARYPRRSRSLNHIRLRRATGSGAWRAAISSQSRRVAARGPDSATEAWQFACDGPLRWAVAGGLDGALYFIAGSVLNVVDADGTPRLRKPLATSGHVETMLVISPAGTLYFADSRGTLYAADANGDIQWQQDISADAYDSIKLDGAGNLYVMDTNGRLHALSPAGDELWSVSSSAYPFGFDHFAVAADGQVYVYGYNNVFSAIRDGTTLWQVGADVRDIRNLWVGPDGLVYIQADGQPTETDPYGPHLLLAYSLDGELLHSIELPVAEGSEPSARSQAADGTLYVVSAEHRTQLNVVSSGAAAVQTFDLPQSLESGISVAADGTLYAVAYFTEAPTGYRLCAFSPTGELRWSEQSQFFQPYVNPLTPPAGVALFGTQGIAYYSASGELLQLYYAGEDEQAAPVCDATGNIYLACGQQLYGLDGDGSLRWQVAQPGMLHPRLALSPADEQLYVLDGSASEYSYANSRLSAYNLAGELRWQQELGTYVGAPPLVGADGTILLGPAELATPVAGAQARWQQALDLYRRGLPGRTLLHRHGGQHLSQQLVVRRHGRSAPRWRDIAYSQRFLAWALAA